MESGIFSTIWLFAKSFAGVCSIIDNDNHDADDHGRGGINIGIALLFWDALALSSDNVIVFAITNGISLDWGDSGSNDYFLLMVFLRIGFCISDTA